MRAAAGWRPPLLRSPIQQPLPGNGWFEIAAGCSAPGLDGKNKGSPPSFISFRALLWDNRRAACVADRRGIAARWLKEFNPFKCEPSTGRSAARRSRQVPKARASRGNWSVAAFQRFENISSFSFSP
jgi:hypothetical protein